MVFLGCTSVSEALLALVLVPHWKDTLADPIVPSWTTWPLSRAEVLVMLLGLSVLTFSKVAAGGMSAPAPDPGPMTAGCRASHEETSTDAPDAGPLAGAQTPRSKTTPTVTRRIRCRITSVSSLLSSFLDTQAHPGLGFHMGSPTVGYSPRAVLNRMKTPPGYIIVHRVCRRYLSCGHFSVTLDIRAMVVNA